VNGDVGQDLAVHGNARLLQPVDEAAVGKVVEPCRGIDPRNPEAAELALARLAVPEGKGQGTVDGLRRKTVRPAPGPEEALGQLHDLPSFLSSCDASLYTCHDTFS